MHASPIHVHRDWTGLISALAGSPGLAGLEGLPVQVASAVLAVNQPLYAGLLAAQLAF